ncbi:MAG: pantoate--beta-alanine ligase [Eubacteriales bacterium]
MKVIKTIDELRDTIKPLKLQGKDIGFVPTMGYLHKGHCSLIEKATEENDVIVVSIFVNPTQFGPNEDFDKYPRDLERDLEMAKSSGATIIFVPDVQEIYLQNNKTYVEVKDITEKLCGLKRPGHFRGVTTVVTKLFNIVTPDKAYFGQKDAQQAIVIKKMVKDLNINIDIVVCPIIREKDGLAMSSRNVYLNTEERKQATILYKSLMEAKEKIINGERDVKKLSEYIKNRINSEPLANIEYVEIVDSETLANVFNITNEILIALAVRFGKTRLIDNLIMEV